MGKHVAFTKPSRMKLARAVSEVIKQEIGVELTLVQSSLDKENLRAELPSGFETQNGPVMWASFTVTHRGVDIHVKFEDIEKAKPNCPGINPYSGKWNHYLWHDNGDIQWVVDHLPMVLRQLRPKKAENAEVSE